MCGGPANYHCDNFIFPLFSFLMVDTYEILKTVRERIEILYNEPNVVREEGTDKCAVVVGVGYDTCDVEKALSVLPNEVEAVSRTFFIRGLCEKKGPTRVKCKLPEIKVKPLLTAAIYIYYPDSKRCDKFTAKKLLVVVGRAIDLALRSQKRVV